MSVEEHHFESMADVGASKTYPQQAGTIRKNGYIVIKARPCNVPHVTHTDYHLIDISEDGFVSLLTKNENTKDDLRLPTDELPTDETSLAQIKDVFSDGKDLVGTVMSSMGEEQICALKDIGPKS